MTFYLINYPINNHAFALVTKEFLSTINNPTVISEQEFNEYELKDEIYVVCSRYDFFANNRNVCGYYNSIEEAKLNTAWTRSKGQVFDFNHKLLKLGEEYPDDTLEILYVKVIK